MSDYSYPYRDMEFVLNQVLEFDRHCADLGLDVNAELGNAVLAEAGRLANEVLSPLNKAGDDRGAVLGENGVQETPGFGDAYAAFIENGWGSLVAEEEFGGQGLPVLLGTAVNEIWHSANMAFALCPMLSQGAVEAISQHGSDELKAAYLPKVISGEWTGTMNLTEPNAGSDLAAVAAKAVPQGDHYLITGQKIFITWGDHQMTENIVHLVLARLPDAPAGVKGISLFVVPKFILDGNGEPGERNDVACVSLEHKLGIHGSPTCVMSFGDNGGAIGYLVGEANKGLAYMFTMMNNARQAVGLQGLSISERAYQLALEYSRERIQGRDTDGSPAAIIRHPDVRRMLLTMRSGVEAMRGLAYETGVQNDLAHLSSDAAVRAQAQGRVDLYTPIVKGWMTEFAQELTSLGVQVHGGMGYVEETGAAQFFRDARILPIYEGTTGIQALDLIGRKTSSNGGALLAELLADIDETLTQVRGTAGMEGIAAALDDALQSMTQAREWILQHAAGNLQVMGAASVDMLMAMGYLTGGWMLARSALVAQRMLDAGEGDAQWLQAKILSARFYAAHLLPRVGSHCCSLQQDHDCISSFPDDQF